MKITVISNGSWGTALAKVLCDNQHDVIMWGRDAEYIAEMQKSRENSRYLKGMTLPENLSLSSDFKESVTGRDMLIMATPTQFVRNSLNDLKAVLGSESPILVNVSKGIEVSSLKRISEITEEVLGDQVPYSILAGPSHAEEVMKNIPTAVVVAAEDQQVAETVQKAFSNEEYFRVYTTDDVIGVELGGAFKNIFAIAAGIIDGMSFGDNSKAALMTRGNVEMARFGLALGGKYETFNGLSGIGDLIVTCTSQHSRNRFVGERLGKGRTLDQIKEEMGYSVAEGVKTTLSAKKLLDKLQVEAPIIEEIYSVLYEDKDSRLAIKDLMTRDPKQES